MKPERQGEIVRGFDGKKVLVVGDLMLDHFVRGTADRVCPEAPALVVNTRTAGCRPGGAANAAANFCSLGASVSVVGLVGGDGEGDRLLEMLRADEVDVGGVVVDRHRPTTTKTRIFAGETLVVRVDREFSDAPGECLRAKLAQNIATYRDIDAIFVSDYRKGVVGEEIMDEVRGRNILTVADPKGADFGLYYGVNAITPNSSEVLQAAGIALTGWDHEDHACRTLMATHGFEAILLTRGSLGVVVFDGVNSRAIQLTQYSSVASATVNVSGAGDTVAAAYTLALLAGASHSEAARVGNLAAGVVVGRTEPRTVTLDEILAKHGEGSMRFEIGHYYRHTTGEEFSIIGRMKTTMWEETVVAETAGGVSTSGDCFDSRLLAVGDDEGAAVNFVEISKKEWMKNFEEQGNVDQDVSGHEPENRQASGAGQG